MLSLYAEVLPHLLYTTEPLELMTFNWVNGASQKSMGLADISQELIQVWKCSEQLWVRPRLSLLVLSIFMLNKFT